MLNTPARNAIAVASPVNSSGVAAPSVDSIRSHEPNASLSHQPVDGQRVPAGGGQHRRADHQRGGDRHQRLAAVAQRRRHPRRPAPGRGDGARRPPSGLPAPSSAVPAPRSPRSGPPPRPPPRPPVSTTIRSHVAASSSSSSDTSSTAAAAVAQRQQLLADEGRALDVDAAGRLGGDHHARLAVQLAPEHEPLLVAARERRRRARPGCPRARGSARRSRARGPCAAPRRNQPERDTRAGAVRARDRVVDQRAGDRQAVAAPVGGDVGEPAAPARGHARARDLGARPGARVPASAPSRPTSPSTSSSWPLPATPATPTTSPARSCRSTPRTRSRPRASRTRRPATSSSSSPGLPAGRAPHGAARASPTISSTSCSGVASAAAGCRSRGRRAAR